MSEEFRADGDELFKLVPGEATLVAEVTVPVPPTTQKGFVAARQPAAELDPFLWFEWPALSRDGLAVERYHDGTRLRVEPDGLRLVLGERGGDVIEEDDGFVLGRRALVELVSSDGVSRWLHFAGDSARLFVVVPPKPDTADVVAELPSVDVRALLGLARDDLGGWADWLVGEAEATASRRSDFAALSAIGLVVRLWSCAVDAPTRAKSPVERCRAWMRVLDDAQRGVARQSVLVRLATLDDLLSEMEDGGALDEAMVLRITTERDDLQSAMLALSYLGPTTELARALSELDRHAGELLSHWSGAPLHDAPRWQAVSDTEVDAWWVGTEG